MSERDGWNHLYLYDGRTGAVKNQITKGPWPVRNVAEGGRGEAADLVQREFQVVNQLVKHDKDFDLLVIPGASHTNGGAYGAHKRFDFFTRQLLGVNPPDWRDVEPPRKTDSASGE